MGWFRRLVDANLGDPGYGDGQAAGTVVRSQFLADAMARERARSSAAPEPEPLIVYRWEGWWTRWSHLAHEFEPVEGHLVPGTLAEFTNSLDHPPLEGERFRFSNGEWRRLDPDEPIEPEGPPPRDAETMDDLLPKAEPLPTDLPPPPAVKEARAAAERTASDEARSDTIDQLAAWRRRKRP